ncbi:UNVERIFIED_CONTAM: ABC-type amino acid transport substrate-binding protein [Brevibacillus sp. OAP136]
MVKKRSLLLVVVSLALLVLSACGAKTVDQSSQGAGGQAGAGDQSLERVKSAGVINVGIEGAYPPFNFYNDKNELVGFDVDIANAVAGKLGVKVNFVPTPWDSIIAGLLAKKYDIIISSMGITDERKQKVDFTEPYYHTGGQLFVPNDSTITDPTKIEGLKIGASIGSTFEEKAKELKVDLVTYKTDMLTFQDMLNGRIKGVITDKAVGANMIKEKNYPFKALGDVLYKEEAAFTVRKDEGTLKDELNKALKDIQSDGTYEKISNNWFDKDIR